MREGNGGERTGDRLKESGVVDYTVDCTLTDRDSNPICCPCNGCERT